MFRKFSIIVYTLTILSFLVLAATGFYASFVSGQALSGYCLMLHCTAAPLFAVGMAGLTLMWAHRYRFNNSDWACLRHFGRGSQSKKNRISHGLILGQKVCFWLMIFLALPVILSITLSMFSLFCTDTMSLLNHLHRNCALLLSLAAVMHFCLIIILTTIKRYRCS